MANLFCVKDKVVIITGGAGILGRGIAGHLAEEGAKIVILDRAAEVGEQIVADIKAKGGEASFFLTDVLNKEILEQNKKDILAKYGRIDALLNAAGGNMAGATIGPDSTIFDLNIDAFRKVVDLNLFGTVLPTMVFADVMANQREGAIVNFSSESALRPLTRVVGYGAAKAAISFLRRLVIYGDPIFQEDPLGKARSFLYLQTLSLPAVVGQLDLDMPLIVRAIIITVDDPHRIIQL